MKNGDSKEQIYEDLLKRIKLTDDQITEAYMYGSRVYGTAKSSSDWDFIVITPLRPALGEQFSDNLINVNFFTPESHAQRIREHEISALECVFLEEKFVLKKPKVDRTFVLDTSKLRHSLSAKSSNSWVKAKKKLTVPESYNDSVGKKSLWHSIRIIDYGIQIATTGRIVDYSSCNHFYDEVLYCNDWSELFEKYKERYNKILTEFRKHAPK